MEGVKRRSLAHAFERGRSIVTNASLHKRRRYVLNLDLEDFFPSINFGRVRGFFLRYKHFSLNEKVATVLAQIACHKNELPQGSPCSPVISNLIAHSLDIRLAVLAKAGRCTYSRYADDITFSTNRKEFPPELAFPIEDSSDWKLGHPLVQAVERSGFRINDAKTRMQYRGSRQVVTGLVVNEKVNVSADYYRLVRSMCNSLFQTGSYYRLAWVDETGNPKDAPTKEAISEPNVLAGMLAHLHFIKGRPAWRNFVERKNPPSALKLYRKFLFYKYFVAPTAPLIIPEGKTDPIYLKAAIRSLTNFHPALGQFNDGGFTPSVKFMNFTPTVQSVLDIGNGAGAFTKIIGGYEKITRGFRSRPCEHPIILLVDNDTAAESVFKTIKKNGGPDISLASLDAFYHLFENVYLVKTPEQVGKDPRSCIEDLFDPELLKTEIDGKVFDIDKEHDEPGKYGKVVFAEKVVKPRVSEINFSRFEPLLSRIAAVLNDYSGAAAHAALEVKQDTSILEAFEAALSRI
jgi:hypothetical protein